MQGCPAPMHLAWSPDGTRLYIGDSGSRWVGPSQNPRQEVHFVWVTPAGETGSAWVLNPADPIEWPHFSPPWNDRTFTPTPVGGIIFSNFACYNPQLMGVFIFREGGLPWALAQNLCGYEFAFSADGSLIAFTETFPAAGVWLMPRDGGAPQRLGDGERPIFSP